MSFDVRAPMFFFPPKKKLEKNKLNFCKKVDPNKQEKSFSQNKRNSLWRILKSSNLNTKKFSNFVFDLSVEILLANTLGSKTKKKTWMPFTCVNFNTAAVFMSRSSDFTSFFIS